MSNIQALSVADARTGSTFRRSLWVPTVVGLGFVLTTAWTLFLVVSVFQLLAWVFG